MRRRSVPALPARDGVSPGTSGVAGAGLQGGLGCRRGRVESGQSPIRIQRTELSSRAWLKSSPEISVILVCLCSSVKPPSQFFRSIDIASDCLHGPFFWVGARSAEFRDGGTKFWEVSDEICDS